MKAFQLNISISIIAICSFLSQTTLANNDTLHIQSPNGKIKVAIWMDAQLKYSVKYQDQTILNTNSIDLEIKDQASLSDENKITSTITKQVNTIIQVPVSERRKKIVDKYNEINIQTKQPYRIIFRVFDNGLGYQINTLFQDSIYIKNEIAKFNFNINTNGYLPIVHARENEDIFHTSFEEPYPLLPLYSFSSNTIAYNPILLVPEKAPKIAITESDLLDYPGMFLKGTNTNSIEAIFAPYPAEEKTTNELYPEVVVTKRTNYIAHTKGTRSFPWRIIMIAPEDKDLPSNDMVYQLASPSAIQDVSWVHPGKATDEWIININLFNIPFKAGLNTATYKYYIDFAARFGFDRIMMDAGWSDYKDLFKVIPEINMDSLVAYAKLKNIKLSMWTIAVTLDKQLEPALTQFNKWGVDFIMTDFIDRDDQKSVQFYERIAKACAAHKIMIMYHGANAPKGFNRTYPNAITREGVLGSEYNIWSEKVTPSHDLILPFTRMLAGSFDYEPGFLNNATKKSFRNIEGAPMSYGTRSHQLAMFVVFDSPMQIFSGNPSQAYLEPTFMNLLGHIPTGWDDTKVLDAKVGEYIVTARNKNKDWYIAGMNNWTAKEQSIDFSFLEKGNYKATICKDGINADKFAADYSISSQLINNTSTLSIHMAPGGGFLIKLIKL